MTVHKLQATTYGKLTEFVTKPSIDHIFLNACYI
jgi:hypothetical protein